MLDLFTGAFDVSPERLERIQAMLRAYFAAAGAAPTA